MKKHKPCTSWSLHLTCTVKFLVFFFACQLFFIASPPPHFSNCLFLFFYLIYFRSICLPICTSFNFPHSSPPLACKSPLLSCFSPISLLFLYCTIQPNCIIQPYCTTPRPPGPYASVFAHQQPEMDCLWQCSGPPNGVPPFFYYWVCFSYFWSLSHFWRFI